MHDADEREQQEDAMKSEEVARAWANFPPGTVDAIRSLTADEAERWGLLADLLSESCRQLGLGEAELDAALEAERTRDGDGHPGRWRGNFVNPAGPTEAQAFWAARWATYLGDLLVSGLPADQMLEQARTAVAWLWACATLAAERTPAPD